MNIKKEILKNINEELTTKPLSYKEEETDMPNQTLFVFKTDEVEYGVAFKKDSVKNGIAYEVMFGDFDEETGAINTEPTNLNNAPVVFSTVYKIIEDFMKAKRPEVLDFIAAGHSSSRLSIYKRFAKKIAEGLPEYKPRTVYNLLSNEKIPRKIAIVKESWLEQNKDKKVEQQKENTVTVNKILKEIILEEILEEAEYQGKKVTLNDPFRTPKGPKKYSVYVKNDKGNVVKVNFGDKDMEIKRDNPERKKSFRARHNCDQKKDKTKAGYWSCKFWSNKSVRDLLKG